jgi:hypothetical protein
MDNQNNSQESLLGYSWLQKKWQIDTVAQLPLVSILGRTRATKLHEGVAQEWYPPSYGVQTPREHLLFALKHEGVNLEFLARLFAKMPVAELSDWLKAEPSSQYARKAGSMRSTPSSTSAPPSRNKTDAGASMTTCLARPLFAPWCV